MIRNTFKFISFFPGFLGFLCIVGVAESKSFEDFCTRIGYGVVFCAVAFVINVIGNKF